MGVADEVPRRYLQGKCNPMMSAETPKAAYSALRRNGSPLARVDKALLDDKRDTPPVSLAIDLINARTTIHNNPPFLAYVNIGAHKPRPLAFLSSHKKPYRQR